MKKKTTKKSSDIRIVVLQRGWVLVGKFSKKKEQCFLDNAHVVRYWGTTRGLGEIASDGPTDKTKLDAIPRAQFHELTSILTVKCEASKWPQCQ